MPTIDVRRACNATSNMTTSSSSRAIALLRTLGWETALYAFALWLLAVQGWGPGDVVWSLWSTSLITGYITLLVTIFGGGGALAARGGSGVGVFFVLFAGAAFMLAFFTVHFGMFHVIHSVFLNLFFPLIEWGPSEPGLIVQAESYLQRCLTLYPAFIALCVLSYVPLWLRPAQLRNGLTAPYANVVKLHLIIMAIGFSQAFGAEYAAVIVFLGVYFLPIGAIWRALRRPTTMSESQAP